MKAKDLQGKNIEDLENDSDEPKPSSAEATAGGQEDAVAAAYENISKKLESIRNGKNVDEEESEDSDESKESKVSDDEPELEEWKGPKPPKEPSQGRESDESDDEDEHELRKVKLHNLEDRDEGSSTSAKASADEEEEDTDKEELEGKEEGEGLDSKDEDMGPAGAKKDWEPGEDDPLDEEEAKEESDAAEGPASTRLGEAGEPRQGRESNEETDQELEKHDDAESLHAEIKPKERPSEPSELPEDPDLPQRRGPDTLDDLTNREPKEEEDEYNIPNLKGSRQGANMSYNAPMEGESSGQGFPKSRYMDSNDPNNFFSQHNQGSQLPKRANKFHLLILVAIGIAVIGFTVYVLKGGFGDINLGPAPSPSPSPTATPEPTPTPTPEPDRGQYKLRVLNGTGKAGLAASVSAKLKELGYQTEKTGNATNSAFTQTVVRVKPSLESFIPQIVKDLAPDYDAAGNASLKDSDAADIEVILGAK